MDGPSDETYITFTTAEFFTMMGKLALPPWVDATGAEIGGSLDCSKLVEDIIQETNRRRMKVIPDNWYFLFNHYDEGEA